MTDSERSALLAAVAKALPPGRDTPLEVFRSYDECGDGDVSDVHEHHSYAGHWLEIRNLDGETLFVTTGNDEAECVARMWAAVGVTG